MSDIPPSRQPRRRLWRHPALLFGLAVLVAAVGAAAFWFQPWKLVTNTSVDESLPTGAAPAGSGVWCDRFDVSFGAAKLMPA